MSQPVNECGYEYGMPEVTPVNIAPAIDMSQTAALLSPKPVVPAVPSTNINVFLKDTEAPITAEDEDTVFFMLNFSVSVFDEASGTSKQLTIPKRISLSKRRLLADAENMVNQIPATVVEEKQPAAKKSESVRMRELAGIPHKKNHV